MKKKTITIDYTEYGNKNELDNDLQLLLNKAEEALKNAYAPYSNYKVGAAVLLDNGKIISGNNQENMAYPSGLCAERIAIFHAAAQYPEAVIKTIAITGSAVEFLIDHPVTPCGACRQVIAEYEIKQQKPIQMILSGENGRTFVVESIDSLLPLQFRADELKKHGNK